MRRAIKPCQHENNRMHGPWVMNCRGSFLIWAIGLNVILLILAIGYYPFFQTVLRAPSYTHQRDQAVQLAEAGVAEAMWVLNEDGGDWAGNGWIIDSCGTDCHKKPAISLTAGDGSGVTIGEYTISVEDANPDSPIITATGYVPTEANSQTEGTVRVQAQGDGAGPFLLDHALYGGANDGWGLEVYAPPDAQVDINIYRCDGVNPVNPLIVGSNNNVNVHPDSFPAGTEVHYTSAESSPSYSPGMIGVEGPSLPMPPVQIPPELQALEASCGGFLWVSAGATETLTGDNCYHSARIWDGGRLILEPDANLYLYNGPDGGSGDILLMYGTGGQRLEARGNNKIYMNGGLAKVSGVDDSAIVVTASNPEPSDLFIYQTNVTYPTYKSFLSQRTTFYGVFYADSGGIHIGNYDTYIGNPNESWDSTYYGAFYGQSVELQADTVGAVTHRTRYFYDECLAGVSANPGATPEYTISTWQTLTLDGSGM